MTGVQFCLQEVGSLLVKEDERWILQYLRARCAAVAPGDEPQQPADMLRHLSDVMEYRRLSGKENSLELQRLRDDLQRRVMRYERWD